MNRFLVIVAFAAAVVLFPRHSVRAQAAPAPAPELSKVAYFLGTWNVEATAYPQEGGAPSRTSLTFQNDWMPGHHFLVMRSTYTDGTTGIAFMGYDKDAGAYTFDEFESTGYTDHSTGTINGDTWGWTSGQHGSKASRDRFTVKMLSSASYSFKFESSSDGSTWKTTMDGSAHKPK